MTGTGTGTDTAASEGVALLPDGWVEKYSADHNRKFWKNEISGKKSWQPPSATDKRVSELLDDASGTRRKKKVSGKKLDDISGAGAGAGGDAGGGGEKKRVSEILDDASSDGGGGGSREVSVSPLKLQEPVTFSMTHPHT